MKFFCHGYVMDDEAARLKRLDGGRDDIGAAHADSGFCVIGHAA